MPSSPKSQAFLNRSGLALFKGSQEDASRPARQQPGQVGLAHRERQLAQVVAVQRKTVEGVELDLTVMLPGMQTIEVGNSVDPKQHRLAIDDERAGAVLQGGLKRITIGPVVTVAGEQPDPLSVALHDQAVAVLLDLVNPIRTGRNLGRAGRDAGLG
jgi:hypothetical protein